MWISAFLCGKPSNCNFSKSCTIPLVCCHESTSNPSPSFFFFLNHYYCFLLDSLPFYWETGHFPPEVFHFLCVWYCITSIFPVWKQHSVDMQPWHFRNILNLCSSCFFKNVKISKIFSLNKDIKDMFWLCHLYLSPVSIVAALYTFHTLSFKVHGSWFKIKSGLV